MEPLFIEIGPEEPASLTSHEGEEFLIAVSGQLVIHYGRERYLLEPGDSVYYNSIVPHSVSAGDGAAGHGLRRHLPALLMEGAMAFTQSVSKGPVPAGVQATRELTLGQAFDATAAKYPGQDAVVYADRDYRLTWSQFKEEVDRCAKGLMGLGVAKGEKVAVWATNVPHWVTLQFATAQIGAVLLTINTNCKSAEIDYLLRQSETENIFIIDGTRDTDFVPHSTSWCPS